MADKYLNNTGLQYYHNRIKTVFADMDEFDDLKDTVQELVVEGGEPNVIESISVNGVAQTITNKNVDLDVPTLTSDLTNDSGFITNAVTDLTNYYTKSQTYTQSEVDSLIAGISSVDFQIVQSLPVQDISTSTIYLLANSGTAPNIYDEYVYINNNWEMIGTTAIDLSGYWTSTSGESNSLIAITTSEIDNIVNPV